MYKWNDADLARYLSVNRSQIANWKNTHNKLYLALKRGLKVYCKNKNADKTVQVKDSEDLKTFCVCNHLDKNYYYLLRLADAEVEDLLDGSRLDQNWLESEKWRYD